MARILVVDDEKRIRRQLSVLFGDEGHTVEPAGRVDEALGLLAGGVYDLIITDVCLPDRSGIEVLRAAQAARPPVPVVVITAYGSVQDAVEAMRLGAQDYIQKPFQLDALKVVADNALKVATLRAEHRYLLDESRAERGGVLIGDSSAMQQVRHLIDVAATQPTTVLLTGESGTGKELAAESVHRLSGKSDRPLVRVNCPAIPGDLFESELFGHLKGAFTGAVESRRGKFELAHGGTLFLDEVSEIPLTLQAKLLRVLEDRRFCRVGGTSEIAVELRVIAATNRDLDQMVQRGRFRQDLYYRLKIFPIEIPPLRARLDDIPALAAHLLSRVATQFHLRWEEISDEALGTLGGYGWPGNVRELRNVLERSLLLSRGAEIGLEHLPAELTTDPGCEHGDNDCTCLNEQVEQYRRRLILEALERYQWTKKDAAASLGLSPRALSHYISKYDLDDER